MTGTHQNPQPAALSTGQRLATTGRAVVQGIRHLLRGEHETQRGTDLSVHPARAEKIIAGWPEPQNRPAARGQGQKHRRQRPGSDGSAYHRR